jgi:hypothetical protein
VRAIVGSLSEISARRNFEVGETKIRKRRCEMTVKIKDGKLLIELELHEATPSTTGKTLGVAGTNGRFPTSETIDGQPVWVIANAFYYPSRKKKSEEETEAPKRKTREAAAKTTGAKKRTVVEDEVEDDQDDEN